MNRNIPYLDNPAWRNGQDCRVQDLALSIMDLGVIHSDATYDVIAVINGKPLKMDQHLDRFLSSCQHWRIPIPYTKQELQQVVLSVHERSGWNSSIIWLSVTRGIPESGNPRDLINCDPDVMCYAKPWNKFNGTGTATVCLSQRVTRVPDCAIDQRHKNWVWPDLTQAQWEAIDRGYDTAVLYSTDGYLTEGPGFNVAIVLDGAVYAPARNRLPGISMLLVEELCRTRNIRFHWQDITPDMLSRCQDMFLTTTVGNIVTVTKFEDRDLEISPVQKLLLDAVETLI